MFSTETVTVFNKVQTGVDNYNAPTYEETETNVEVLIIPGEANDVIDSNRPDGVIVAYTLHFPKAYTDELANKDIRVRSHKCHVIGHPDRYMAANTPGKWNMPVYVERVDG